MAHHNKGLSQCKMPSRKLALCLLLLLCAIMTLLHVGGAYTFQNMMSSGQSRGLLISLQTTSLLPHWLCSCRQQVQQLHWFRYQKLSVNSKRLSCALKLQKLNQCCKKCFVDSLNTRNFATGVRTSRPQHSWDNHLSCSQSTTQGSRLQPIPRNTYGVIGGVVGEG